MVYFLIARCMIGTLSGHYFQHNKHYHNNNKLVTRGIRCVHDGPTITRRTVSVGFRVQEARHYPRAPLTCILIYCSIKLSTYFVKNSSGSLFGVRNVLVCEYLNSERVQKIVLVCGNNVSWLFLILTFN